MMILLARHQQWLVIIVLRVLDDFFGSVVFCVVFCRLGMILLAAAAGYYCASGVLVL